MTYEEYWTHKATKGNILTLQFLVLRSGPQLMHHFYNFFGVICKRVTKGLII